jgi:hypothetical protein
VELDLSRIWRSITRQLRLAGEYSGSLQIRYKVEMLLSLLRICFMDSLKAACYRLIQQVVLAQYPACRRCQKPSEVGHHIFKRDRLGTAFNPLAVVALCNACHAFVHSKPSEAKTLAKEWLGDDYEKLQVLSRMVVQFRDADYRIIRDKLKEGLCN